MIWKWEKGGGERISLNKIKSEKAGAFIPEFYPWGRIPSVITRGGGWGVDFPALSQGRMRLAGWLATSLTLLSPHLPRCNPLDPVLVLSTSLTLSPVILTTLRGRELSQSPFHTQTN